MTAEGSDVPRRMDEFKDMCRRSGIKATHQRMAVFEAVAATNEHPDVETVYEAVRKRLPTISLDTVYRTLWTLRDIGVITTMGPPRERVRFDADTSKHHHFVCRCCGKAYDFCSSHLDELPIPDEVGTMGKVETTHVEVRGLCSECLAAECRQNGRKGPAG